MTLSITPCGGTCTVVVAWSMLPTTSTATFAAPEGTSSKLNSPVTSSETVV